MSSVRRLALATYGYRGGDAGEVATIDGAVLVEHVALVDDSEPFIIFLEENSIVLMLDASSPPT